MKISAKQLALNNELLLFKPFINDMNKLITHYLSKEENRRLLNIEDIIVVEKDSCSEFFISYTNNKPFDKNLFMNIYNNMTYKYCIEKENNKTCNEDIFDNIVFYEVLEAKVNSKDLDKNIKKKL